MTNPEATCLDEMPRLLAHHGDRKAWGYVRVSTKGQEDGESPEVQRKRIIEYCRERGLDEPCFVVETATGSKPMFDFTLRGKRNLSLEDEDHENISPRPMFFQLLSHLEDNDDAHLVFWKLDRLSRHDIDQELILRQLWGKGVEVHSTFASEEHLLVDGGQTNDPQRDFFRAIMAATAVYERRLIQMRLDLGKDNKASKGGFTGGRPAYGYYVDGKELAVNDYQARMIRLIYQLRHDYRLSYAKIASYLTKNKDPRDPSKYHKGLIHRILSKDREKMYRGNYCDHNGRWHSRPDLTILTQEFQHDGSPSPTRQPGAHRRPVPTVDRPVQDRDADPPAEKAPPAAGDESPVDGEGPGEGAGGKPGVDPGSVRIPERESNDHHPGEAESES